jgi:hypothetical protein
MRQSGCIMPHRKALRGEFSVNGDMVVHMPTGAFWTAHPKDTLLSALSMGELGALLDNGDEYDPRDVHELAVTILAGRITP